MKVTAVLPLWPSATAAAGPVIESEASSLRMMPLPTARVMVAPAGAPLRVTVKVSSASTRVSPETGTAMLRLVTPAAKVMVPLGSTPPKSAASAGLAPEPATTQLSVCAAVVSPLRVTVNTALPEPLCPSTRVTVVAVMA